MRLSLLSVHPLRHLDADLRDVTLLLVVDHSSSGGIAAWAIWKEYAFLWGAIIAAAQLADALKEVFPFAKIHKAASDHTVVLNGIFIDAQLEWESIFSGRYTDDRISSRRHKLMRVQHEAERQAFPVGLPVNAKLFAEAQSEAKEGLLCNDVWCRMSRNDWRGGIWKQLRLRTSARA